MMTSNLSDIPSRSQDGLAALDLFYIGFNDINFFVEDADHENLYEVIFRKAFPEHRISRIFPLGGKSAVLSHAEKSTNNNKNNIYVLDKDFDDFLGKIVSKKNIYYLDRYCIENYLMESNAICELVVEHHPRKKRAEISNSLNVEEILNLCFVNLRELFTLFYCAQLFELGIRNCGAKVEEFCLQGKLWLLDESKLNDYRDSIFAACNVKAIVPPLVDHSTDTRTKTFREAPHQSVISGKFVLSMVFHYIKSKYNLGSITFESFVYRLAKNSSFDSLNQVTEKIKSYIISDDMESSSGNTNEEHFTA